ncbi:MAG: DUF4416 family protein [Deferribacteraceae bacterium]|jgi:hypothetical protein|nr:DUF4416 family protein [Deferribacteraceae bacterium]
MLRTVQPVIYFAAVMYNPNLSGDGLELITEHFGDIIKRSDEFDFEHTTYYEPEMGERLRKYFVAFKGETDPAALPRCKLRAIEIENRLAQNGKRVINIDPGYLAMEKIVVASTKNFTHRIYINSGIYGDLQLMRQKGEYTPMPWTYADYALPNVLAFFKELSKLCVQ